MCTTWETTWAKWRANRRPGCQVRYIDTCMQPTLCSRQMRECGSGRVLQYLSYPNAPGGHDGAKRQLAGNQGAPFPFPPSEEGWNWRDGRDGIEDQATGCTAQLLGSWAPRLLGSLAGSLSSTGLFRPAPPLSHSGAYSRPPLAEAKWPSIWARSILADWTWPWSSVPVSAPFVLPSRMILKACRYCTT